MLFINDYRLHTIYFIYSRYIISKCLRQTATRPCGTRAVAKSCKLGPKILYFRVPNPVKSVPWGILEGSGDHMGPSWAQDSPKSSQRPPKADSWTPPGLPKNYKNTRFFNVFLMVAMLPLVYPWRYLLLAPSGALIAILTYY